MRRHAGVVRRAVAVSIGGGRAVRGGHVVRQP